MVDGLANTDISVGTMARMFSPLRKKFLSRQIHCWPLVILVLIMLPSPYTLCMLLLVGRISLHLTIKMFFFIVSSISSYHLILLLVGRGHRREDGAQLNLHRDSPWIRIQIQIHVHCTNTCTNTYTNTCKNTHANTDTNTCTLYKYMYKYTCKYRYKYMYIVHIHVHIHIQIHV